MTKEYEFLPDGDNAVTSNGEVVPVSDAIDDMGILPDDYEPETIYRIARRLGVGGHAVKATADSKPKTKPKPKPKHRPKRKPKATFKDWPVMSSADAIDRWQNDQEGD
jgi:hypothetical protein